MKAEEILENQYYIDGNRYIGLTKEGSISAMQEYAKQEVNKALEDVDGFLLDTDTDDMVYMKARELDEKDFQQYMYDKFWKPLSEIILKHKTFDTKNT